MKKKMIIVISGIIVTVMLIAIGKFCYGIYYKNLVESGYQSQINSANQHAINVTMTQLISRPEKYDGKLIRVIGVGNLEFEGDSLWLSMDDYTHKTNAAVWMELGSRCITCNEAKQFNGKYVIAEGIFRKDNLGHMDMFCGAITDISRYELWD